jgi:hypothetical protein
VECKKGAMKMGNGPSNRGAVLLAELKVLVDSFPHHHRTAVIKTLETVLRELGAHHPSCHSVNLQPEVNSVLGSPFPEAAASLDLDSQGPTEDPKQKEDCER